MKSIYTYLLVVAILLGALNGADAQARLSLNNTLLSNTTPNLGAQISLFTVLKNESLTDTFAEVIDYAVYDNNGMITPALVGKDNSAGHFITLAPQETRSLLFTIDLNPSYFSVGPDIIIVWPISTVPNIDTARAPLVIRAATGINDIAASHISAYMSNDKLFVHSNDPKISLRQVQIYDLLGKVIYDAPLSDTISIIPLHQLPAGVYVADIIDEMGQSRKLKFVK